MATVTADWKTQDIVVPNAATFNQYDVQIINQADNSVVADATVPLGTLEWIFPKISPGDYLGSVSLMDSQGNIAAPPDTFAFTIPTEPTAPVPVSLTITLS